MTDTDRSPASGENRTSASGWLTPFGALAWAGFGYLAVLAYGMADSDPAGAFDEGRPGTYLSVLLLLASGAVNFRIRRRRLAIGAPALATLIWPLMGTGFVFLAFDEAFMIHEKLDHLIHSIGGFEETPVTDRIDDMIVFAYGLLGLTALVWFRREITGIAGLTTWLACGVVVTVVMVAFDALSNGSAALLWLGVPVAHVGSAVSLVSFAEDVTKIAGEAVLLAGFVHALRASPPVSGH